jgi:ankyrin repeat protein
MSTLRAASNSSQLLRVSFCHHHHLINLVAMTYCRSQYSPLHYAAMYNREDVSLLLLQSNADVNAETIEYHLLPLFLLSRGRRR